eukprot:TRINITY_DN472_c0_g1_i2.p1 TRINITY_DN472_c0_g1~~TRINITY_DN472_c0_g1_i2.p1  ORF type:complete len:414 (-),score=87.05 TRINITY_DN472_c0_g1_i2:351-1592(-)
MLSRVCRSGARLCDIRCASPASTTPACPPPRRAPSLSSPFSTGAEQLAQHAQPESPAPPKPRAARGRKPKATDPDASQSLQPEQSVQAEQSLQTKQRQASKAGGLKPKLPSEPTPTAAASAVPGGIFGSPDTSADVTFARLKAARSSKLQSNPEVAAVLSAVARRLDDPAQKLEKPPPNNFPFRFPKAYLADLVARAALAKAADVETFDADVEAARRAALAKAAEVEDDMSSFMSMARKLSQGPPAPRSVERQLPPRTPASEQTFDADAEAARLAKAAEVEDDMSSFMAMARRLSQGSPAPRPVEGQLPPRTSASGKDDPLADEWDRIEPARLGGPALGGFGYPPGRRPHRTTQVQGDYLADLADDWDPVELATCSRAPPRPCPKCQRVLVFADGNGQPMDCPSCRASSVELD